MEKVHAAPKNNQLQFRDQMPLIRGRRIGTSTVCVQGAFQSIFTQFYRIQYTTEC